MNTFEKHNISYLSPSTINLFISQPALCMLKFAGYTDDEVGPPAWRGTAVDKAVGKGVIEGWELEHLTEDATTSFWDEYSKYPHVITPKIGEKAEKEAKLIPPMIKNAMDFYKPLGNVQSIQGKIKMFFDDIEVPFIGYYDLEYEDTIRDTKTVSRTMSGIANSAKRQVAIYSFAKNKEAWIDYVTAKEVRSFKLENAEYWLKQVEIASHSIKKILSFSDDILECCQLVYPDLDHWMWSKTMTNNARTVWDMDNPKLNATTER
tara:strand:- start:999 stop:1787 length:789 start_codon:yes stop_codon:yes gene_type:complete